MYIHIYISIPPFLLQTAPTRRVVYFHAEADTTHVSEPDGTQVYHFPNQQASGAHRP